MCVALRQQPGQRQLRHRAALLAGDVPTARRAAARFRGEVLPLKAGHRQADVLRRQRRDVAQLAGQEAAREWTEGDERDAQLAAGVEHRDFGIARPQRVLGLHGGERVHAWALRIVAADTSLRPIVLTLPSVDQIGDRADALFDRHALVPAMQVIEIDDVGLQPRAGCRRSAA